MTRRSKVSLYIINTVVLLVAIISINLVVKKHRVASMVERARYAVKSTGDLIVQTNRISRSVSLALADRVRNDSAIKAIGKKSVCFGGISLLDEDMQPIVRLSILRYPLFQFNGVQHDFQVQIELEYDLVGAYGFKMPDYECR